MENPLLIEEDEEYSAIAAPDRIGTAEILRHN